jgi:hypothetical protein
MNSDYEKGLEGEIDRELKALPELPAPRTLAPRVLAAIAQQARVPWYRQSWQGWPVPLQAAALVFLLAMFAGLCFAGWRLPQSGVFAAALRQIAGYLAGLGTIWNTVNVLVGAMALVVRNLGTGFLIAVLVDIGLGYALCVSLGTFYVRLAFARR